MTTHDEAMRLADAMEFSARLVTGYDERKDTASLIRQQAAEIKRLTGDNANMRTVMIAAAEEIHRHWKAHCDADGYGPANLQRRLEEGIPAEYGYTAGAFERLRVDAERWQWAKVFVSGDDTPEANARTAKLATQFMLGVTDVDAAIDAARKA